MKVDKQAVKICDCSKKENCYESGIAEKEF